MQNSFRFFRNTECRYFPCHDCVDEARFNCLFCYCPLYFWGNQCGGDFKYVGESQCVKSCECCTFPHVPENYDTINRKLKDTAKPELAISSVMHSNIVPPCDNRHRDDNE